MPAQVREAWSLRFLTLRSTGETVLPVQAILVKLEIANRYFVPPVEMVRAGYSRAVPDGIKPLLQRHTGHRLAPGGWGQMRRRNAQV